MKWLSDKFVGRIAIAAGILYILQVITLFGFFGGSDLSAGISDILVAVSTSMFVPLFLALGLNVSGKNEGLGRLIRVIGVLGALVKVTGSLLLISGAMPYSKTIQWESVGVFLMGIAIVSFVFFARSNPELSKRYVWFSLLFGLSNVANILGLFGLNEQFEQLVNGAIGLSEMNPIFVVAMVVLTPIFLLGGPIWLIGTGRLFLRRVLSLEN